MLRTWCKINNLNNPRNLSHVLMDGGVLSIPFDKLREFYDVYIKSIKAGEKIYVVEQKTETYNFFMDVDYKDDECLTLDQVSSICQIICDKVQTFHSTKCLISVGEPKPKDSQIKTGIHLNWQGLVVNQAGAIQLMHHVVHTLEKVYSAKDWTKIIDSSVYGSIGTKGSGFRLPWSHKKAQHTECKGAGCLQCENGKITEGEYLPVFIHENGTMKSVSQDITLEKLELSTVRTTERTVVEIPELVIICQPIRKARHEGDFTKYETKDEVENLELSALLETFIRKNIQGNEDTRVLKVFKYKNIYLLKTTSRYCDNIRRNHNSNHVKFIVDDGHIYQKCFCRCDTTEGRRLGPCKDFSGRKHELKTDGGKRICDILYPNKKTKKCNVYVHDDSSASRHCNVL
jgi:hypothetical protein